MAINEGRGDRGENSLETAKSRVVFQLPLNLKLLLQLDHYHNTKLSLDPGCILLKYKAPKSGECNYRPT